MDELLYKRTVYAIAFEYARVTSVRDHRQRCNFISLPGGNILECTAKFDVCTYAPISRPICCPGSTLATLAVALLGLLIGSFLNVVIHRIPKMMQRDSDNYVAHESGKALPHTDRYNLLVPRPACPRCGHKVTALESIPVISWLALHGKCGKCRAPISARYPTVELGTAILSAALVWQFGTGWTGLATLVFGWLLVAMTCIDLETQLLPDDLTMLLLWLGLLVNLKGMFVPLNEAVIGAAAGYLVLWLAYWMFKLTTGKEGMGYGDFKLLAALGAWLGWAMLPTILLLSSAVAAAVGLALITTGRLGRGKTFPFGPYLAGAGVIAALYGGAIAAFIHALLRR